MQTARINPALTARQRVLWTACTLLALGMALAAAPLGFVGGAGLHRLLQPHRPPLTASLSQH
ncbi:MAG: hypothetical protein GC160_09420 [Acidobacteria bacterium]|nr:hypothetical protein [Acidobacteriota bacterium]